MYDPRITFQSSLRMVNRQFHRLVVESLCLQRTWCPRLKLVSTKFCVDTRLPTQTTQITWQLPSNQSKNLRRWVFHHRNLLQSLCRHRRLSWISQHKITRQMYRLKLQLWACQDNNKPRLQWWASQNRHHRLEPLPTLTFPKICKTVCGIHQRHTSSVRHHACQIRQLTANN